MDDANDNDVDDMQIVYNYYGRTDGAKPPTDDDEGVIVFNRTRDEMSEMEIAKKFTMLQAVNSKGNSALHLACMNGNIDVVKKLIEFAEILGIEHEMLERKNKLGYTPLFCACFRGYVIKNDGTANRLEIVKTLLKTSYSKKKLLVDTGDELIVNMISEETMMTPLHWAAYNSDDEVIEVLLRNRADPYIFSLMGRIPIDVAGSCCSYEVVDVFLKHYTETEIVLNSGTTKSN